MAQLLTTIKSSHGVHPSIPSPLVKSVQKLGSNCVDYGKLSNFSETRSSSHKILSASPPLSLKGSRRIRCSASNAASGQQGNVIAADDGEALEKSIEDAGDKLVVVAVSTTTCGPCKLIFPKVVKMSTEYPDAVFFKIDGDKNSSTRALMRKWGVRAVPNFRFYNNGKLIHSHSGAKEDELRAYFLTHYIFMEFSSSKKGARIFLVEAVSKQIEAFLRKRCQHQHSMEKPGFDPLIVLPPSHPLLIHKKSCGSIGIFIEGISDIQNSIIHQNVSQLGYAFLAA